MSSLFFICIYSKEFVVDEENKVTGIRTHRVKWSKKEDGGWAMTPVAGSEETFQADLVLLAMGFVGPEQYLAKGLSLETNSRFNTYETCRECPVWLDSIAKPYYIRENVFTAGDCRRGQSLVVHAINEGRQAGRAVDLFLRHKSETEMKSARCSQLATTGGILVPPATLTSQ